MTGKASARADWAATTAALPQRSPVAMTGKTDAQQQDA